MRRREFIALLGAAAAAPLALRTAAAEPATLASAPLELAGEWGGSPRPAAMRVLARMREVCLEGVGLVSDRQPERLRVDAHDSGPPAVWLHADPPRTAWVIVDIGARDWSKLAYQFGHELGHVLCNSWWRDARPRPPCQWLEEAMVEAFSLRGLGLLADRWERDPPFAGDAGFGRSIRDYRRNAVARYAGDGGDIGPWFRASRTTAPPLPTSAPSTAGPSEPACRSKRISTAGPRAAANAAPPAGCRPGCAARSASGERFLTVGNHFARAVLPAMALR
jgi:hypothetical protein